MPDVDEAQQDKQGIPVEGPAPSDTPDLQRSLTPRLSDEDEEKLAHRILKDYHDALQDRSEWENRLNEWDDAYFNKTPEKDIPWPNCANFHVPITMMGVETFKPRLVEGVLGQNPPILVMPTRGADEDKAQKVETFLNWQVQTELKLEPTVTQSAHLFLHPGLAIAKTYWKVERHKRKMVREFPLGTPIQAIFEGLFGTEKLRNIAHDSTDDLKWTAEILASPQGGGPLEVTLRLNVIEDEQVIQVLVEREVVSEHPQVDMIEPIDLIVPVKGGHEISEQPWVQQRLWMTEDELRRKARLGRFYPDAVEEVLQSGTPKGDRPGTDSNLYRDGQDATEGVEGQGPSNVRRTQFVILEDYRRYDLDGDGIDEEIIAWVSPDAHTRLLGYDYLDNVYAHGRRPIRVGRYFPIPFRFYGLSFAEVIKGIQDEINTIHNQRVDYGTIQNMPFFFYRASASIPDITMALKPGEGKPVDNPQTDIAFPKWQGSPAWGQSEEALLMQHFERLSGLTDLSMGRQPNRVGATRTATGTQTLLSESGLRFKNALQAFQRFWLGIFDDILALDQEYLPANKEFRVTGRRPTVMKIKDRLELQGRYDLRLVASTENMNRQRMRDDATILVQAVMNPALMQGGLVGVKGIRRVMEKFLKAFGEDPEFYLEPVAPIRSPVEELMMFMQGEYVAPVQGENYQLHLIAHQAALMDPDVPPKAKPLIQRHIQETQQVAQAAQMAQAMQQRQGQNGRPPTGEQARNAERGAQPQPNQPAPESPQGAGMGMPPQGAPSAA